MTATSGSGPVSGKTSSRTSGEKSRDEAGELSGSRPTVFIHTNHRQIIGAMVSRYSMKRNSATPDAFDVRLIKHSDYDFFEKYEGRPYLREGASRIWRNDDLQSFTPLRFSPPELMDYQGRAVVTDPARSGAAAVSLPRSQVTGD